MALEVLYSIDLKLPAGRLECYERMRVKGRRTSGEKVGASVHFSPTKGMVRQQEMVELSMFDTGCSCD